VTGVQTCALPISHTKLGPLDKMKNKTYHGRIRILANNMLKFHSDGHNIIRIITAIVCNVNTFMWLLLLLFHCTVPKLMIGKRYYLLSLIPVFIVQVTKVGTVYLV
jgi:hypothetical protein